MAEHDLVPDKSPNSASVLRLGQLAEELVLLSAAHDRAAGIKLDEIYGILTLLCIFV